MVKRFLGVEISFQFYYFALLTIVLIFDKNGGIFCCFLSSFFHEIGHLLAILVLKQKVDRIEFSLFDIKINTLYLVWTNPIKLALSLKHLLHISRWYFLISPWVFLQTLQYLESFPYSLGWVLKRWGIISNINKNNYFFKYYN